MEKEVNPLVCFFDSGIGGINLLAESVKILPRVDFNYFADNFRMPYGVLNKDEILKRVDQIFINIEKLNPSAAVVACNTVTAQCIDFLREKYSFKILGIQPAVKPAAMEKGRSLVLATPSTAGSTALKELVQKYGNQNTVIEACGELAEYIENHIDNLCDDKIVKMLPKVKADSVVLGCTHYIFAKEIIQKHYKCRIFDGIEGTANNLRQILGIFDHQHPRAQKIAFTGGDEVKNRRIFNMLLKVNGSLSQK